MSHMKQAYTDAMRLAFPLQQRHLYKKTVEALVGFAFTVMGGAALVAARNEIDRILAEQGTKGEGHGIGASA